MIQYTVKRLLSTIPVLLGISVMLFFMLRALPGHPAQVIAGDMATQKEVELIRHQLGLDRPTHIQYGHFLWRLMRLDLGNSIKTQNPVISEILPRLKNTAILAVTATLLACLLGIPAGIVAAVRPYTIWDILVTALALFGISMPAFWLGLMLIVMFSVKLHWLPVGGSGGIQFLVLPAVTMASPARSSGCAENNWYVAGEAINLSASPASGWVVISWNGTANDSSTSNTNSVTMPAMDHVVQVIYGAQPDAYEVDNVCGQAHLIDVDGPLQEHNYHVAGDADWVRFDVTENSQYRIECKPPSIQPPMSI